MKKHLSKLVFIFAVMLCFSVSVSAQKDKDKKGERKPPVIHPNEDRKPKNNKPKDTEKKDQSYSIVVYAKVGAET